MKPRIHSVTHHSSLSAVCLGMAIASTHSAQADTWNGGTGKFEDMTAWALGAVPSSASQTDFRMDNDGADCTADADTWTYLTTNGLLNGTSTTVYRGVNRALFGNNAGTKALEFTLDIGDANMFQLVTNATNHFGERSGNNVTVNIISGTMETGSQTILANDASATATLDVSGGTFRVGRNSLKVGGNGSNALARISGGSLTTRTGLEIDTNSTFEVQGSGATLISPGGNGSGDGFVTLNGTLKAMVDATGITPIFVEDDGDDGGAVATFNAGSKLDVSFLDTVPFGGTWTVLEVEGGDITDNGLAFAAGVDEGIWSFAVDNSGDNGLLTVTANVPQLFWDGQVSGLDNDDWDIGVTANWEDDQGDPATFSVPAEANFDDLLLGTGTVNLTTTFNDISVVVNNSAADYDFTGSGKLSGITTLLKNGSGILTLGNTGANDFTGAVEINGGTVKLGSPTALGSTDGQTQLNSGGTLDLNGQAIAESFSNNDGTYINSDTSTTGELLTEIVDKNNPEFDGPGDIIVNNIRRTNGITRRITKNGAGKLTLGGTLANNRYGLTVNGGDVDLDKPDGVDAVSRFPLIMNAGAGTVTLLANDQIHQSDDANGLHQINAGTLDLNGFNETLSYLSTTNGTETDGIVTNSDGGTTSTLTILGNPSKVADATYPGAITGNLALFKGNTSTQILTGTNTFTGGTTVGRGTLVLGTGGSFPTTNTLVMGSGGNAGTLQLGDATGPVDTTVTSLTTSGTNASNQIIGGNATTASVLTVNSTDPTIDTYGGRLGDGVAGDTDANRVSLVKQGTGTLRINRAGSYTGGTTIQDGVLSYGANGAFGTGDVTINGGRIGIGNSGLTIANNLIAGGNFAIGSESSLSGNASGITVSGGVDLGGATREVTVRRTTTITGAISNGGLNFLGVGSGDSPNAGRNLFLDGVNTYTGDTTVTSGTLNLRDTGVLRFVPSNNGVSNQITGSGAGSLNLDGEIFLDLSGADTTPGNGWTLVDVANVTESYGGTFSVNSSLGAFVNSAGEWTLDDGSNVWTFSQASGVLSVATGASAYDTWKAANAPTGGPDDDFDGDGVANAVEFVLGGLATTNDLDKLPTLSTSGGNLLFSFERDQTSIEPGTTVTIEVSTDLSDWSETYAVPDGAASNDPGVSVVKDSPAVGTDTVTLSVVQAPDTKKFARLNVVIAE